MLRKEKERPSEETVERFIEDMNGCEDSIDDNSVVFSQGMEDRCEDGGNVENRNRLGETGLVKRKDKIARNERIGSDERISQSENVGFKDEMFRGQCDSLVVCD